MNGTLYQNIWEKVVSLMRDLKDYIRNYQLDSYILSESPLILASFWYDFLKNLEKSAKVLPQTEPIWFFFSIGNYKSELLVQEIKAQIAEIHLKYPLYNFWFMNNSQEEDSYFQKAGLNSIFANHNTFLDENRYRIMNVKKKYDAIYLARFTPVKRHYLAKDIKRLLLIGTYKPDEIDYYNSSRAILDFATYKAKVLGIFVTNYMNQAHVGLALSDFEGAMYASSEYLLSGLPVVSTPSVGGRDAYYREDYVKIVEPDSRAVAEAVYELIKNPPDADMIRTETIKIMNYQRQTLISVIENIYHETGTKRNFSDEWQRVFIHKLGLRTRIPFPIYRNRILRESTVLQVNK